MVGGLPMVVTMHRLHPTTLATHRPRLRHSKIRVMAMEVELPLHRVLLSTLLQVQTRRFSWFHQLESSDHSSKLPNHSHPQTLMQRPKVEFL
jgi:hypothetical protein